MSDPFLNTLLRNAPFLVVLMPLVGAALVAGTAALGGEAARRTGLANALVTAALALVMAVHYAGAHRGEQGGGEHDGGELASRDMPWLAVGESVPADAGSPGEEAGSRVRYVGPGVRATFAVDGINVWFAVLLAVAMLPVLRAGPGDEHGGAAGFYVLLLVYEACLLGTFLAADVAVFAFCAEGSLLPVFLMIGGWGGYERRTVAVRWLVFQAAGGAAIVTGLMLLVLAARWAGPDGGTATVTFAISEVAGRLALSDHPAWGATAGWAFGLLVGGGLLRGAVVPLHTWFLPAFVEAPPATSLMLTVSSVPLGVYGLLRFVVPIFPWACAAASGSLVLLGVAGFVFAALLVLAQGNLAKIVACTTLASAAACAAAVFSTDPTGTTGAVLYAVHHGAAVGLLAFVVGRLNVRFETTDVEAFGGLAKSFPRLAVLYGLAVLSIAACPLGSGFVASLLVVKGVFGVSGGLACWFLVGALLLAWSMLWNLQRLLQGRPRMPLVNRPNVAEPTDLSWGETAAAVPFLVLVLWLGVWPRTFVDVTEASVRRAMRPYAVREAAATPGVWLELVRSAGPSSRSTFPDELVPDPFAATKAGFGVRVVEATGKGVRHQFVRDAADSMGLCEGTNWCQTPGDVTTPAPTREVR